MIEEVWKPIKGYEDKYLVSSIGNVMAKNFQGHGKQKLKTPTLNKEGYFCVILNKDAKSKLFRVHRLVADAFILNPENKPQVDHINTVRTDNRVENLRWVTNFENSRNELTYKKIRENGRKTIKLASKACEKKVLCVETGVVYNSAKEAAASIGVRPSSMTRPLKMSNRRAKGFHWRYA